MGEATFKPASVQGPSGELPSSRVVSKPKLGLGDWRLYPRKPVGSHRALTVAMAVLIILSLGAVVLERGVWQRAETWRGPFTPTEPGAPIYRVKAATDIRLHVLFGSRGDGPDGPRSDLRLWVNGEPWGPPHGDYTVIRAGQTRAFSHWRDHVYFALPDITNDASVIVTSTYSIGLRAQFFVGLLVATAASVFMWLRSIGATRLVPVAKIASFSFPLVAWLVIGLCWIYWATILYGFWVGDALPTATLFRIIPARILASVEVVAPYTILTYAAVGAALSWLGSAGLGFRSVSRRMEIDLFRIWRVWSLPVVASIFTLSLSASGWGGHVRPTDLNYMSFAGLIPHSDAHGYFSEALQQAYWGTWGSFSSRRPLAQAFRQLTAFAGQYSYATTLLIQVLLLSVATHLCLRSIARWRGLWAAIAFFGLTYLIARPFMPTMLTEVLGLIWTLFALIFFIEALRLHSAPHALVALIGLSFALLTRVGSVLTVPFLVMWLPFAFSKSAVTRARLFALACAGVAAAGVLSAALGYLYAPPDAIQGGNVAWHLCGLSLGGNWGSCMSAYASELGKLESERSQFWFLLLKAWQNVANDPMPLLRALRANLEMVVEHLPPFLLQGYGHYEIRSRTAVAAEIMMIPAIWFVLRHRASSAERTFWIVLCTSIILSSAFFVGDDGWRLLTATHPLLACLLAFGFCAPAAVTLPASRDRWQWQRGGGILVLSAVLFLLVPSLSHTLARREIAAHSPLPAVGSDEAIVLGSGRITGFVIIADGATPPRSVPSLDFTEFRKLVEYARLEEEFGPFVAEIASKLPIALVGVGRLDTNDQSHTYVAPPVVLERRDVWAWHLRVRGPTSTEPAWIPLQEVVAATPVP